MSLPSLPYVAPPRTHTNPHNDVVEGAEGIAMAPLAASSRRAGAPRAAAAPPLGKPSSPASPSVPLSARLSSPLALFSLAFFLLGLLNNSLYVVILTSALELLPTGAPTGLVALANIGPALIAKAIWPYVLKGRVRYARRIASCIVLATAGMLVIAFIPALSARLLGISMASFASGLGELTFLQLCTRYGTLRAGRGVGWFASGTGAAGLFGAGAWWVVRPLGVRGGLSIMALLPLFMAVAYWLILPSVDKMEEWERQVVGPAAYQPVRGDNDDGDGDDGDDAASESDASDAADGDADVERCADPRVLTNAAPPLSLSDKMALIKPMLLPFIAPLVLVYLFEYTINQGIAPTLLYPPPLPSEHRLLSWMIKNLRDYYPLYQLTYQTFVFLSRSSVSILRIPPISRRLLWLPAFVQLAILLLLTSESLHFWFRDSIARSLVIVLVGIEGLAGGWTYVSVFYQIGTREGNGVKDDGEVDVDSSATLIRRGQEQEFRVGCVGVGDSMGILVAALISMPIQLALCDAQVSAGRELCKQV